MFANRLAHRLAHLGIFDALGQSALGNANRAGGDVHAANLEAACSHDKALAFFAADQALLGVDFIVFKNELTRIDALIAKLLQLLAVLDALERHLGFGVNLGHDQHAHALVTGLGIGVGLDQQGDAMAFNGVRDPGLGAIDDIIVALAARDGADAL